MAATTIPEALPDSAARIPTTLIARVAFAQAKDELGESASLRQLMSRSSEIVGEFLGPQGARHTEFLLGESNIERELRG